MSFIRLVAVAVLLISLGGAGAETLHREYHQYCVVGAGPGGLQVAYFMKRYGMDFVLLERGAGVGMFFERYPRQRTLISINKVHTGRDDPEFNMRHDWNSLLLEDETKPPLLFKNFSSRFYPPAQKLVEYLREFAEYYGLMPHTRLQHNVTNIKRVTNGTFGVYYRDEKNGVLGRIQCDVVVLSAGKSVPVRAKPLEGGHLIEPYDEIPTTPSVYRNLEILIIGNGNSALEFIQSVEDETAAVHLATRTPMKMSWQTHYPGHPRARNLGILDKYQLKSLDVLLAGMDVKSMRFRFNETNKKIYVSAEGLPTANARMNDGSRPGGEPEPAPGAPGGPGPLNFKYDKVIGCLGFVWDLAPFTRSLPMSEAGTCGSEASEGAGGSCSGPDGPQEVTVIPSEDAGGRYPAIASNYESPNIPGLFAAGSLAHYRDFKKSAGGFIHGFRYTARTLVRYLRERYNDVPYPVVRIGPCEKIDACAEQLVEYYANRFVNVSSLYQMQSVLGDAIVTVARTDKQYEFAVLEDIPLDMATSVNPRRTNPKLLGEQSAFLTLSLEFGKYFQGSGVLHHQSQPDIPSRATEKVMWSPESDPDALMLVDVTSHSPPPRSVQDGHHSYAAAGRTPPGDFQADFFPLLDEMDDDNSERDSLADQDEEPDPMGCPSLALDQHGTPQFNTPPLHGREYIGGGQLHSTATVPEHHTSRRGFQMLHPVFRRWDRQRQQPTPPQATSTRPPTSCKTELELPASTIDSDDAWTSPEGPKRRFDSLRSFLTRQLPHLVQEL